MYPVIIYNIPTTNGININNVKSLSAINPNINPNNIGIATKKPPIFGNFKPSTKPININGKTVNHVLSHKEYSGLIKGKGFP